jgi:uroporphyrinogen-III synthase
VTEGGRDAAVSRPLAGCRVVVTRPRSQAGLLEELLLARGATVVALPTITIAAPASYDSLDAALKDLAAGGYEWIAFLSVNAVEQVLARLHQLALDVEIVGRARVVAVGGATAEALSSSGVAVDLVPDDFTAAGVATALGPGTGSVLVPRAADAPAAALDPLRSEGWQVDEAVAYRTEIGGDAGEAEAVRQRGFDVVTFTSGSTARGFAAIVGVARAGLAPGDPGERKVACIGPATAKVATGLGFRVDAIAAEHSAEGLVQAVVELRTSSDNEPQDGTMEP